MTAAMTQAEYLAKVAAAMSEDELLAQVRRACVALRLRTYHTYSSRRSEPGFPDLVIVGPRGVLWRELKTARGRLTEPQKDWLGDLTQAHQNAAVWRPIDLLNGTIVTELETLR